MKVLNAQNKASKRVHDNNIKIKTRELKAVAKIAAVFCVLFFHFRAARRLK